MWTALLVTALILSVVRYYRTIWSLCPGPPSIPILGAIYLIFNSEGPKALIDKSLLKYGDIARIEFGMLRLYVVNGFEMAKELFNKDCTSHRPTTWYQREIKGFHGQVLGIIEASGQPWVEQRRFGLKNLKDFGFGRKSLDLVIQEEADLLIQSLLRENQEKNEVLIANTFNAPIVNALWQIVASNRLDPHDEATKDIMEKLELHFKSRMEIIDFAPLIRPYLPISKSSQAILELKEIIRKEILTHEQDFDPNAPPRDFIDTYLTEIKRTEGSPVTNFHREQLVTVCLDFFLAGSETTSTTLTWSVILMAIHPEIQEKCYQEIHQTIGSHPPMTAHLKDLTYCHATMLEVQRISATVPATLPHITTEEIRMDGYVIPKDSLILANLRLFLHDAKAFPNPKEFNPSRFLDDNGKIVKPDQFVPFGFGKRICMGESLAKSELFIFLTSFIQKTRIGASKSREPLDIANHTVGMTCIPDPFYVVMEPRKS
ncbi:hypothetical protein TCAL_12652 [Tigriopus californicus]|uniref:Cytochrome P450 n=2 Tax=Tigriopus californicus TaxID=6832 RepID=A0A553PMJ4_TIGCA|nr:hypothetical protein TCAL_12652 [Tigriopus californicus]|eukprot:TCALIF_12652-PA protein Name:"Similar to Cyp2j3 Cytochrome P450 2J3 (Rattus norvegicus)" AED:0.02 eAED:0.02 QI:0/-1/0/1/-1/1/1/0/486